MYRCFLIAVVILFTTAFCDALSVNSGSVSSPNDTSTSGDTPKLHICDICQCTADTVNCSGRQLGHHFENSLWPVTPLQLVTFEDNSIVHLKPFPNVTINKLILRYNKINKIDDKIFKEIRNLSQIDLSHNLISSDVLKPETFQGSFSETEWNPLPNLKVLNLGHNELHSLNQDLFVHIRDLEVLILNGNPLQVIDHPTLSALSSLTYLKELCLESCGLDSLPHYMLHTHKPFLKKLYLNGNRFSSIPTTLEEATALEYLNLDENPFVIIDQSNGFPKLPALKQLRICSTQDLIEIGPGAFSKLISLEELYLCNNPRLKHIDEDALVFHGPNGAIWPPIKKLDISNNALKYLPANLLLGRWGKLEKLSLTNNDWSCDCENQYLIGTLIPNLGKTLMPDDLGKLFCSAPPEHAGKNLTSLSHRKLRCLDLYGARPERDAAILVGVLIGLLLALPLGLILFLLWRRGFFFCGPQTPASFSRAFYKRTANDES
ncbi:tsukushin-like [Chelonus insularis]|uniref:tsukushin-like n=1 Tax=Chelonus insularis TaxID=460826 RepID=UPI00158ECA1F|nr:tsukushin-like [Chelonus insularis]